VSNRDDEQGGEQHLHPGDHDAQFTAELVEVAVQPLERRLLASGGRRGCGVLGYGRVAHPSHPSTVPAERARQARGASGPRRRPASIAPSDRPAAQEPTAVARELQDAASGPEGIMAGFALHDI